MHAVIMVSLVIREYHPALELSPEGSDSLISITQQEGNWNQNLDSFQSLALSTP